MIDKKYRKILQPLLMSISMGFVMSIVMTLLNLGFTDTFFISWRKAFMVGISVSIPTGLIMGPLSQKILDKITH